MARRRWKRKSGYITPNLVISKKELLENDLFLNPVYDDWADWRDGFRDWFRDFKLIKPIPSRVYKYMSEDVRAKRIRMNQKQQRLLTRRKARRLI
ncbi:hypothetical protein HYU22_04590 [Candidatus Woesearchaeota archaeon]|nr:hypothetical protein [Candidatus Woesearchaeota archaeon]